MEISGPSFHILANDTVLTFSPPMIDVAQNPDGFVYHWKQLQRVFNLPDPAAFPPLGGNVLRAEGRELVERYVDSAKGLAASSLIGTNAKVQLSPDSEGKPRITISDFPTREVVSGFSVMFRQLYSTEEPTHLNNVAKVVGLANEQANDGATAERRLRMKAWTAAHRRLQGYSLDTLLGLQLEKEGKWASCMTPRLHDLNPQQLISIYLNGDLVHWDAEKRRHLAAFRGEDEIGTARELDYLKVIITISHIFIGFAVLVQAATSGHLMERR